MPEQRILSSRRIHPIFLLLRAVQRVDMYLLSNHRSTQMSRSLIHSITLL